MVPSSVLSRKSTTTTNKKGEVTGSTRRQPPVNQSGFGLIPRTVASTTTITTSTITTIKKKEVGEPAALQRKVNPTAAAVEDEGDSYLNFMESMKELGAIWGYKLIFFWFFQLHKYVKTE